MTGELILFQEDLIMRYDHLESHFDIDNSGDLDFMEKNMMEAYVWETFRNAEEETEEDDYDGDDWQCVAQGG